MLILIATSTTLNGFNASLKWRIRNIQLLVGVFGTLLAYIFLNIVQKNYTKKGERIVKPWQYWFLLAGFVCGYLVTRFFLIHVSKSQASKGRKIGFFFSLVTTDLIEEAVAEDKEMRVNIKGLRVYLKDESDPNAGKIDAVVRKDDQEVSPAINPVAHEIQLSAVGGLAECWCPNNNNPLAHDAPTNVGEGTEDYDSESSAGKKDEAVSQKVHDEASAIAAKAQETPNYPGSKVEGMYVIHEVYRYLGVIASFTMCLSHGSNSVASSISPLLIVQQTRANYLGEPNNSKLGYWVGGAGIAFGIILLGKRVMTVVGKKIVRLNYMVDFCSQMAAAISIIFGSYIGMPVSTNHCIVGSLLGVYLARKLKFVNYAYCTEEQKEEAKEYLEESAQRNGAEYGLNKKLFAKIFAWWLTTVPAAFILAGVTDKILQLFTK